MNLLILLFAHLLADYPLQGDFVAKMKGKMPLILITHCGIWTGCICSAAHFAGISVGLPMVGCLFGVHAVADYAKANGWYGNADALGWPLWVDQGIHVLQCVSVLAFR